MLQHFLLMYVLETHERRRVISATAWKRSKSESFLLWSCLHHIICFPCEVDCIRFHRGFITDDMLCTRVDRTENCCSAWGQQGTVMPRLTASKPRREKLFFPFFFSLSSLSVSQLYMFNELASFLSVFISSLPDSSTPSLYLHARTRFFLFLFFFSIQCSSCWHSQRSRRDWGKVPSFAIKKHFLPQYFTFLVLTFTVPYSMPRVWSMRGEKNYIAVEVTMENGKIKELCWSWGSQACACKNDNDIKWHILHFNLSTRIVLIRTHHHLKWILCVGEL